MDMLKLLIAILGLCGITCIRMFLPYFILALSIRFQDHFSFFGQTVIWKRCVESCPSWLTSDWCLLVLGFLAALEIWANFEPEIKEFLVEDFEPIYKPILNAIVALGILNHSDVDAIQKIVSPVAMASFFSGFWAFFYAGCSYGILQLKRIIFEFLLTIDSEDDLCIQTFINCLETMGVMVLLFIFLVWPVALTILLVICWVGLMVIAKYIEKRAKTSCPQCASIIHCSAVNCPKCGFDLPHFSPLNILGLPKNKQKILRNEIKKHQQSLRQNHRCVYCATLIKKNEPMALCEECGHRIWHSREEAQEYLNQINQKALKILCIAIALTMIPMLGVVFAIILMRISLISPLQIYDSYWGRFGSRFLFRILKIFAIFVTLLLGILPFLGSLPIICCFLFIYNRYRKHFIKRYIDQL